jgi:hypothetical protein
MTQTMINRAPRLSRRWLVVMAVPVVLLAFVGTAFAKEPTGAFTVFKQCPRFTTGVRFCLYSQIQKGSVKIGTTTVPINEDKKHEIVLQGGYSRNSETGAESFFGALNGETLSKTPQNVPGGLLDIVNCTEIKPEGFFKQLEEEAKAACKAIFENEITGIRAVTELAKPATSIGISTDNLLNEEGTALSLPVKVKLENPLLGSECYIGSSSSPVTLNLTTGTTKPPAPNTPISGHLGEVSFLESEGLGYTEVKGTKLVDNSFSAPEASGCGGIFSIIIDPIVDAKLGLPSAGGKNAAIQEGQERYTLAEHVIASEK